MADPIRTFSKTLEAQLFELFQAVLKLQSQPGFEAENSILINTKFSADNAEFTGSFRIPMDFRLDERGNWIGSAKSCLEVLPPISDN